MENTDTVRSGSKKGQGQGMGNGKPPAGAQVLSASGEALSGAKTVAERAREIGERASDGFDELARGARGTIEENPWSATLSVLAVGMIGGILIGLWLNRD